MRNTEVAFRAGILRILVPSSPLMFNGVLEETRMELEMATEGGL